MTQTLEKIVFVAHPYHKKTGSCNFMVDYLKEFFDVEVIYDEESSTGKKVDWGSFGGTYKAVVIWQMFPKKEEFAKIPNKNIIFFPMYDGVISWSFRDWLACENIKIINFCLTTHKLLKAAGFNSIYLQYFVKPGEFSPGNPDEVFFWQRVKEINIKTLVKIFKGKKVKIHIHKAIDPGQKFMQPTSKEEEHFKITYSEWFNSKEDLVNFVKTKGIYIAPRAIEGIGMAFLEAMAQGKLVIASNRPTMSEYITHGKTGFLCDFKKPSRFNFNLQDIEQIQKNAYEHAKTGYLKYLEQRKCIIDFINSEPKEIKISFLTKVYFTLRLFKRKHVFRMKTGKNASITIFDKRFHFKSRPKNNPAD